LAFGGGSFIQARFATRVCAGAEINEIGFARVWRNFDTGGVAALCYGRPPTNGLYATTTTVM
jgi:hypothetical protein